MGARPALRELKQALDLAVKQLAGIGKPHTYEALGQLGQDEPASG